MAGSVAVVSGEAACVKRKEIQIMTGKTCIALYTLLLVSPFLTFK